MSFQTTDDSCCSEFVIAVYLLPDSHSRTSSLGAGVGRALIAGQVPAPSSLVVMVKLHLLQLLGLVADITPAPLFEIIHPHRSHTLSACQLCASLLSALPSVLGADLPSSLAHAGPECAHGAFSVFLHGVRPLESRTPPSHNSCKPSGLNCSEGQDLVRIPERAPPHTAQGREDLVAACRRWIEDLGRFQSWLDSFLSRLDAA